jgi:hypothetical protein
MTTTRYCCFYCKYEFKDINEMYLKFVEKTRYYENDVLIVCKKCYEATEEEQMEKEEKLAREELQH